MIIKFVISKPPTWWKGPEFDILRDNNLLFKGKYVGSFRYHDMLLGRDGELVMYTRGNTLYDAREKKRKVGSIFVNNKTVLPRENWLIGTIKIRREELKIEFCYILRGPDVYVPLFKEKKMIGLMYRESAPIQGGGIARRYHYTLYLLDIYEELLSLLSLCALSCLRGGDLRYGGQDELLEQVLKWRDKYFGDGDEKKQEE